MTPAGCGNGGRPDKLRGRRRAARVQAQEIGGKGGRGVGGTDGGLALCRSCSQRVAVGTGVPARTPAPGPVLKPHQLSFAVLDPPPADWKMPLPLVATLPTNRLKLTLSVPLSWAMAPPAPVGARKVSAARLFTKWVRRIVTVPPLALACSPPPTAAASGAGRGLPEIVELVMVSCSGPCARKRFRRPGRCQSSWPYCWQMVLFEMTRLPRATRCNAAARAGAGGVAIHRHAVQRQRAAAIRVAVDVRRRRRSCPRCRR